MDDENYFQECLLIYGATGGIPGPQGGAGFQGMQGIEGIGLSGNQGTQGDAGLNGIGTQGVQGIEGLGLPGIQGLQGIQGDLGIGTQGRQGRQGYQGILGTAGNNGFQGNIGTQGNEGLKGDIGNQGFQGLLGGGITTTNYTPSLVSGGNLTAVGGSSQGFYTTIGVKKFAYGSATWRWANNSQTGGSLGNTPSISFPAGFFTTVQQFFVSVSEVGGDAVQFVNGDLSGLNTVGNFWVWRPVASGSGVNYFFTMSFIAIGV